jgi:DNA polymerase III delta prime subunit
LLLNESHGLRKDTIRALLVALEALPDYVAVILTTTVEGMSLFDDQIDAHPLLSRCIELPLARRGLAEAFAKRAHEIADAEGLNGRNPSDYLRLAKDSRNSMRAMLQRIEAGWALTGEQAE